jgi:hypothetical protein
MASPTPPSLPPQPGTPSNKKISPLVWILGGVAVVLCGIMVTCGIVGFLAVRAVKNAGFDPDLMQRNPGLAMTKMAAALHPDLETVSTNERTGTIVMREKSSGKVVTLKFDPDKKTLVMAGDDGKEVRIAADADGKSVKVDSSDGTVSFGAVAGNAAPAWVPVYPGSTPEGTYSAKTGEGAQNTFGFKTSDSPAKVIAYYQDNLKSAGFTVNLITGGDQGGMVQAENSAQGRTVIVTVGPSGGGAQASVMAVEKK